MDIGNSIKGIILKQINYYVGMQAYYKMSREASFLTRDDIFMKIQVQTHVTNILLNEREI